MAVLSQSVLSIIEIMRNVTGRVDANDPLFSDTIMIRYLNNFLQTSSSTDIRIFQNRTWLEFTIDENSADPYPINLDTLNLSTIEPPAYVGGFEVFWYQDPQSFYQIWPETQSYQPSRPTYILYYNNELVFRNPPDDEYTVKIAAYNIDIALVSGSDINSAYLYRYLAYGAALDIFADYGELESYNGNYPIFMRYKNQVLARTHQQYMNQRATPRF